jgi:hypothetical protein
MGTATINIQETNGISSSKIITPNVSNLNFGSAAIANLVPADYPIPIADTGYCYSFEKWIQLVVADMGTASIIDNFAIYCEIVDGYHGDEIVQSNVRMQNYIAASYPSSGPKNNISTDATIPIPTSKPIQTNVGIGGLLTGAITAIGQASDYIVLQLRVSINTPVGAGSKKIFYISWDEQ